MCGFLAIYNKDSLSENIEHIKPLLAHRGPDKQSEYRDLNKKVDLYFFRLSIIDLETGGQPIISKNQEVVAVFNGEIYNYLELREELMADGYEFITQGDAEVITPLYEKYGDKFVSKLEGMFTISLWDSEKEELHIYRDRFGIKQLYYTETENKLYFSSEVKPLLALPGVSRSVSEQGVFEYLSFGYTLGEISFFKDIKKVPQATHLIVKNGKIVKEERYWDFSQELKLSSKDELLNSLDESIKLHLRSDVKVGAFLSGGLDSGMLVARASKQYSGLSTYTLKFSEAVVDESVVAEEIAKKYKTKHKTFTAKYDDLLAELPKAVWACDEPLADSGILANFLISSLAAKDNCKVVISGAGGDELFGGYSYHVRSEFEKKFKGFEWACRLMGNLLPGSMGRKWYRTGSYDSDPGSHYLLHTKVFHEPEKLSTNFDQFSDSNKSKWLKKFRGEHQTARLYADLHTYIPDNLMVHFDRATMTRSIEGRVPFLHHPLVERALNVPSAQRNPNGSRKQLLKDIARDHLPESVFNLPKIGFNSPVSAWMNGPVGQDMLRVIRSDSFINRDFWKGGEIKKIVHSNLPFHQVWSLFQLEMFCRVHIDNESNVSQSNLSYEEFVR